MNDFVRIVDGDFVYYKSKLIDDMGFIKHIFTTRHGGVSTGEVKSLNLGINKNDTRENVIENFNRVCKKIDTRIDDLCVLKQIHTDNIYVMSGGEKSQIYDTESRIRADAIVSNINQSSFGVFYADCVGVILADKEARVAAAVHSGWRSAAMHITKKAVRVMKEQFGAKDICAAIGPSIRSCCFEADIDCAKEFDEKYFTRRGNKFYIDLQRVIKDDLKDEGIFEDKISDSGICTCCNNDEFFSNRAQKGKIGLMGSFVKIDFSCDK